MGPRGAQRHTPTELGGFRRSILELCTPSPERQGSTVGPDGEWGLRDGFPGPCHLNQALEGDLASDRQTSECPRKKSRVSKLTEHAKGLGGQDQQAASGPKHWVS